MTREIIYAPDEVWTCTHSIGRMTVVAYDDYFEIGILDDPVGRVIEAIVMRADGSILYDEEVSSPLECEFTFRELYKQYLNWDESKVMKDDRDLEAESEDREIELDSAVEDMLLVFKDDGFDTTLIDKELAIDEIKEIICTYLYAKFGFSVFRPMLMVDEKTGDEAWEEYPYDYMGIQLRDSCKKNKK